MSSWEFDKLIPGCEPILPPGSYGEMYLLPAPATATRGATNWLVGAYKLQTRMATAIREDARLQAFFGQHSIRLGLRDSDVPPAFIDRVGSYGSNRPAVGTNAKAAMRKVSTATPARAGLTPDQRITDQWANRKEFWDSQTPQSHHIVEFNHLAKIGASHEVGVNDLDHAQLPCVLLAAEFHQRYISLILKQTHGWGANDLKKEMPRVYHDLYTRRSSLFGPLWSVSKIILAAAQVSVPPNW